MRERPGVLAKGRNVIFPGSPYEDEYGVFAHASDIAAKAFTIDDDPTKYFSLGIIVVVWYGSSLDEKVTYHTAATYGLVPDLRRGHPAKPIPVGCAVGESVPQECLLIFNTSTVTE